MSTRTIAEGLHFTNAPTPDAAAVPTVAAAQAIAATSGQAVTQPPAPALAHSAPAVSQHRLQAKVLQAVLDDDIDELIDELRQMPMPPDPPAIAVRPAPPAASEAEAHPGSDLQLDQLISQSFSDHLECTRNVVEPEARARALHAAVNLLSALGPQHRSAGREQIAACVAKEPDSVESDRILARLVDDFIEASTGTDAATTAVQAVAFSKTLSAASADLPFVSKCKLLVIQLWAAKRINAPSMAATCTTDFINHVRDDDPEVAVRRIAKAASYIDVMPMKFGLLAAMALDQCVPADRPWQLEALNILAAKDILFTNTSETHDFFKGIHQRIYALRISEADT